MATHTGIDAPAGQDSPEPLIKRWFTTAGRNPLDAITWVERDVWVGSKYEHLGVEAPDFWSDNAVAITSKLYLSKAEGSREHSVRQLIERVAAKITVEAMRHGYFGEFYVDERFSVYDGGHARRMDIVGRLMLDEPPHIFFDELCHVMVYQIAVFNSPVLFNVGRDDRPQAVSACYILAVDDTTTSIMETVRREAFIFKGGSGTGFSLSSLRGSMEELSTGGWASGPVSFMRLWDANAGTFKSGGTTRRAAKLVKLDADHPDIRDFITCKVREEERIEKLIEAGVNLSFSDAEGERNLAESTSFQNANNSVGASDEFMQMALDDHALHESGHWPLIARKTGKIVEHDDASDLLDLIAQSAHACACPGMMWMDAMNRMHTTPMINGQYSPINSSNPCGEYISNDDTSCNLGSLNVLKFVCDDGSFDVESFRRVVDVMATSMDVLISFADFPDEIIADRSHKLRQIGLGYSNMGAAIMAQGLAYDSDAGRDFAASVTALETGRVYHKSAELARQLGSFHYFDENRDAMLGVISKHVESCFELGANSDIKTAAWADWQEAQHLGSQFGFRNAQATVVPPAGTTSYFLDCDTTGIEPAFELVIHKEMAGGGTMTIVNQSVRRAAGMLGGYSTENIEQMAAGDFSCISPEDAPVFYGANQISAEGHIRMMAAVQPFVSGAISKTINMPNDATWQDVRDAYALAWRLGCKDLAIYRDGSKARQPHSVKKTEPEHDLVIDESTGEEFEVTATTTFGSLVDESGTVKGVEMPKSARWQALKEEAERKVPERHLLPRTRRSITHKIHLRGTMGDYKGYVHAGMYEDGRLAEIFIDGFGRAGSFTLNALARWGTAFSKAIQYGIPWEDFGRDSLGVADETGGMVVSEPGQSGAPPIRSAKSVFDYIVRWLALEFGDDDLRAEFGVRVVERRSDVDAADVTWTPSTLHATVATVAAIGDKLFDISKVGLQKAEEPHFDTREFFNDTPNEKIAGSTGYVSSGIRLGPICGECGNHMRATGGCFTCSCGNTTGCG